MNIKTSTIILVVLGIVVLIIFRWRGKLPFPTSPVATTVATTNPLSTVSTETLTVREPPTQLPTLTPIPTPLGPLNCNYPTAQSGWTSTYFSENFIQLDKLYAQLYTRKRDYLDLFAIAYYNNLKAFDDNSYHTIDPIRLSIEKGWKVFLPPPAWIEEYRAFPSPILEEKNLHSADATIEISGSSTLYPLSMQISNCYKKGVNIDQILIKPNSTKRGLLDYCQGDVDLFSASEEITQDMMNEIGCEGVVPVKFEVAKYAVTIFISEKNPYADNFTKNPPTKDELKKMLFSANSWNDVRTSFGNQPINRYYPPVEGGEFEIVKGTIYPSWESTIPNLFNTEEYLIPSMVTGDDYSVGFSGYVYADHPNNKDGLRLIPVDNILPNENTINIDNPIYPLTRILYLYTGETDFQNNPVLRSFINYYLGYELNYVNQLGYFYPNIENWLNNPNTFP
jgi:phosphate transport system substrate-binding protein